MPPITRSRAGEPPKLSEKAQYNADHGVNLVASSPTRRRRTNATRKPLNGDGAATPSDASQQPSARVKKPTTSRATDANVSAIKKAPRKKATGTPKRSQTPVEKSPAGISQSPEAVPAAHAGPSTPPSTPPNVTTPPPAPRKRTRQSSDTTFHPPTDFPSSSSTLTSPTPDEPRRKRRKPSSGQRPYRPAPVPRNGPDGNLSDSDMSSPTVPKPRKGKGKQRMSAMRGGSAGSGRPSRSPPTGLGITGVRFDAPPGSPGDADDDGDGGNNDNAAANGKTYQGSLRSHVRASPPANPPLPVPSSSPSRTSSVRANAPSSGTRSGKGRSWPSSKSGQSARSSTSPAVSPPQPLIAVPTIVDNTTIEDDDNEHISPISSELAEAMQFVPSGSYLPGPSPETDFDFEDLKENSIPPEDFDRSPAPSPESDVPSPPAANPIDALFVDVFGPMPPEDSPEAVEIHPDDEEDGGSDGNGDGNGNGDDDGDDNGSNPDDKSSSSSSSSSPSSSSSDGDDDDVEIITADTPPIHAVAVPITLTLDPAAAVPQTAEQVAQDEADRAAAAAAAARHQGWEAARAAARPVEDMNDEIYDPPSPGSSAVTLSERGSVSPRSEGSRGSAGSGGSKGSKTSKSSSGGSSGRSKASTRSQHSNASSERTTRKSPSPSQQLAFEPPPYQGAAGEERDSPPEGWVQWHERRGGGGEGVDEGKVEDEEEGEEGEEDEYEYEYEDGEVEEEEPRLGWFGAFLGLFW